MEIHRARFVPYPPSAINALAFSHAQPNSNNVDPECLRLAIGRANGNIEIWNPTKGAWLQERVFYGGKDRSVEGLAWTQEPDERDEHGKVIPGRLRLFSIGYSSSVTEWDLATGLPTRHSNGNHSEVWCLAAQPRATASTKATVEPGAGSHQKLVAGCADGTLVLLSTAENDLGFDRFVSRSSTKKARTLSVTFKDQNTVLAGFADSMVRVFDTRNGNVIRNISLGSGPHGGPKEILVWKVKCLPNGDFVSGDSTGDIRIYDGKNFSQTQRISGHEADVLDLAVSRDGTMIFSGGMDRRTCLYTCSKKAGGAKSNRGEKWRKISHKRYHGHDVKAMATYEGNQLNVVVSGGIDTQPIVVPLRHFGKELSRGLAALPQVPPLVSAPEARLMVSYWNCELRIWRIKPQSEKTEKPKVVARLALQGDENITSVSVSQDGGLLAVATAKEVKNFELSHSNLPAGTGLQIRKLEMPSTSGARLVRFSADAKWLAIINATNIIRLVRIVKSEDETDRPRILPKALILERLHRDNNLQDPLNRSRNGYSRAITHAEFSADGTMFAVADLAGYVDTWVTEGHEDSTAPEVDVDGTSSVHSDIGDSDDEDQVKEQIAFLGQRWVRNPSGHLLPRLDSAPILLSFQPDSETVPQPNGNPAVHPTRRNPHPRSHEIPVTEHRLLVVSAEHQLYHFEVLAGRLSEWSRRNPPSSYPSQFRLLDSPAKGCLWDTANEKQRLWIYGEKWLFMFDLSRDFPIPGTREGYHVGNSIEEDGSKLSRKRKRELAKGITWQKASGAGDVVPEIEAPVTKIRKFNSGKIDEASKVEWTGFSDSQESDEDVDDKQQALITIRRSSGQDGASLDRNVKGGAGADEDVDGAEQGGRNNEAWWCTFKYRPILGMVPVGESENLEVVLVERPEWDLDMPPRFVGAHE